jgi:hypothetical protein
MAPKFINIYSPFAHRSFESVSQLPWALQSSLRCLPVILISSMPPTRTNLIRIAPKRPLPAAVHPVHPIPLYCNQPNRRAEVRVGHQPFPDLSPHSHSMYPHIATQPGQTCYLVPTASLPPLHRSSSLSQAIRLDGNKRTCRLEPPGNTIPNSPNVSTTRPIRYKHLPSRRDLDPADPATRFSYSRSGGDDLQLYEDELLVLLLQNRRRRMELRKQIKDKKGQMALEVDGSLGYNMIAEITGVETHTANMDTRSSSRRGRSPFGSSSSNTSTNGTLQLGEDDCKVCFDRACDHCLVPCGHMFCGTCAGKMKYCPVCRTRVNVRQRLFKP